MDIKVISGDITKLETDAILVGHTEGESKPGGVLAQVDQALGGEISRLISDGAIKGKLNEINIINTLGRLPARRVAIVGLGKGAEINVNRLRGAIGEAFRALRRASAQKVATAITRDWGIQETDTIAQTIAEGSLLGLYTFRHHITKPPEFKEIEELLLVGPKPFQRQVAEKGLRTGKILAEATIKCRDMVNEPANVMTPTELAAKAKQVAKTYGLECTILEREDMKKLGMGGLLGVSQGSVEPPKFIILRYWGADKKQTPIGFVGKGITFDSGGISLKPSENMGDMKEDMAGGAAVICALGAIAELKLKVNITGLIPATENLPGGSAQRPGDIVKFLNGKTAEIGSTDAEGRLILADALSYARKEDISPVIDLATLTGACMVALGDLYNGAFSNHKEFLDQVVKAGELAGEKHWQLPLVEEYKEQIKSDCADMKNIGGRYGGAITAALFLSEFIEDTPWVHLDIAGPVRSDKDKGFLVKGATGIGVRTLVNLAMERAKKK
ncbi:MAG: pepA [Dehalococcoidia bacterium]|nr:pepA [Dehalococcoidia bacterium]